MSPATRRPYPLTMVCEASGAFERVRVAGATSGVRSSGAGEARAEDGTE